MKVVEFNRYGPPEVLELKDREIPRPGDDEVLVKIYATSVTTGDTRLRKADPFIARFFTGLFRPRLKVLGYVLAGEIEEVGKDVRFFQEGDTVFGVTGMRLGAYAEYICLPESGEGFLALKPEKITFKEAAAIPFGALTALHFLNKGKIGQGQKVLVYGASGAVGSAAIQLAKYFGAEVVGVCSGANVEWVKLLGADRVMDYKQQDLTDLGMTFDIIFDTVGKSPFSACVKSLSPTGFYLRAVHLDLKSIFRGLWVTLTTNKKVVGGVANDTIEDLLFLKKLVERGHLKPVVDRTYSLEEIAEAHRYVDTGRKKGNVIVTVASHEKLHS